uniref:Pecanex-like protein n=1 Tax=Echinostoma caproni TaxID=27848 RepID=A0A183AYP1_9TREM
LIKDPEVTRSFEHELIFPDDAFTLPKSPPCSPNPFPEQNESTGSDIASDDTGIRIRAEGRTHRRVRLSPHATRYAPTHLREIPFYVKKHYAPQEAEEDDEDEEEEDALVVGDLNEDRYLGDTYIGASRFMDDPYDLKLALHSQDDLMHTEPISITQDPLVPLASPPKTQLRDSPGSPQKEHLRSSLRSGSSTGLAAPTILKRTQSALSSTASASTSSASAVSTSSTVTSGPTGPKSSLSSSRSTQSIPPRRSRVVFSRTVLVGNGSETIQLNCPSETDDEEDRRRQVFRPTGNFSVDDLVINRTSQPWIQARKPDGIGGKELVYPTRSTKSRTRTVTRKTYRPLNTGSLYRTYQERITNGFSAPVMKTMTSSHPGQQHHHNCQAARQALKTVSSTSELAKRDAM